MIELVERKSFQIRKSGRSTDFISPSFGFGCLLDCSYCYMKRHLPEKKVKIATNTDKILTEINKHVNKLGKKFSNQTDEKYWTYDIACNEDFALHAKHHEWKKIFDFFKNNDKLKASLATKIIPERFLEYNPEGKVRIRFSLMPQEYSTILEPNTPKIIDRIKAIDRFIEAGYDVHINFSPIIVEKGGSKYYRNLFNLVNSYVTNKDKVKCECIFLTHNENKHKDNLIKQRLGEELLWTPENQEIKKSQYGGDNIRYKWRSKEQYIKYFKQLHQEIIPWCTIRYIF